MCLVTQRTREGPCVAFNSLHCLPKANLGQAQSLTAHGLWMDEWKVKYAFKCKTEDWPGIVVMSLGECEICRWPRQQQGRGQFQLEKLHSVHVCRWWAVIHRLWADFHVAPCVKNKWCRLHLVAHSYCHTELSTENWWHFARRSPKPHFKVEFYNVTCAIQAATSITRHCLIKASCALWNLPICAHS